MKIIYSKFEQDNIKKEKSNVKSYVPGAFIVAQLSRQKSKIFIMN